MLAVCRVSKQVTNLASKRITNSTHCSHTRRVLQSPAIGTRNMSSNTASDESNAVNAHTRSSDPTSSTDPSAPAPAAQPSSSSSKRIFAPTSDPTSTHAEQYNKGTLDRSDLDADPLAQFHAWFATANANNVHQPETVCLSTASLPSGRVSSRYVYLKELDATGFVIYSNFGTSRKAADLESNSYASLSFWWREMERQVRVEGRTERLTSEQSQVYFDTRIRSSRIGAWASKQSQTLSDRAELEGWVKDVEEKFEGQEKVPVPEFWGGLRIVPDVVEFWQGRQSRLHDRFRYTKEGDSWRIDRLSP